MAEEFSKPNDDSNGQEPGQGFSNESDDNSGQAGGVDITPDALKVLQKRDESAQAHITQLESENNDLRTEKSELANALSSATTLDEVMTRMNDTGNKSGDAVSPDEVADAVEARLQSKAQKQTESDNWDTVVSKLTETYGEWAKADTEVQTKAASLGMSVSEATALARRNPSVFYELFLPKSGNVAPQQSIKSAASGQTPTSHTTDSNQRDRQFYKAMRTSKSPQERDKYWSVDNQKQMRRDLYGAE